MKNISVPSIFLVAILSNSAYSFDTAQSSRDKSYGNSEMSEESKTFSQYLKAAELGDVKSQYVLGQLYSMGKGVDKNRKAALHWFMIAANNGDPQAQYVVGLMYKEGEGTAVDLKQAIYWFKEAASREHAEAQFKLGIAYAGGKGGLEIDNALAYKWFKKSAEKNNDSAQYFLGSMYFYGQGIPKDLEKAKYWIGLAREQGNRKAIEDWEEFELDK